MGLFEVQDIHGNRLRARPERWTLGGGLAAFLGSADEMGVLRERRGDGWRIWRVCGVTIAGKWGLD